MEGAKSKIYEKILSLIYQGQKEAVCLGLKSNFLKIFSTVSKKPRQPLATVTRSVGAGKTGFDKMRPVR